MIKYRFRFSENFIYNQEELSLNRTALCKAICEKSTYDEYYCLCTAFHKEDLFDICQVKALKAKRMRARIQEQDFYLCILAENYEAVVDYLVAATEQCFKQKGNYDLREYMLC